MINTKKNFKTYQLGKGWAIQRTIEDKDIGYGLVAYQIIAPNDIWIDTKFTLAEARESARRRMGK